MTADAAHPPDELRHEAKPGFRAAFFVLALVLVGYLIIILVSSPGTVPHPGKDGSHEESTGPHAKPVSDHE